MPDITVLIGFHREGMFAIPALQSLKDLISDAVAAGLTVEVVATLDRADEATAHIVTSAGLDQVVEVQAGDIASARNAGVEVARGDFIAVLDGDDLWGADWLTLAHKAATREPGHIWHPEYIYAFHESDLQWGLPKKEPHHLTASCFMLHQELDHRYLDIRDLAFENFWSASSFASADTFRRHRYREIDHEKGLGIEDFSWNVETIVAGYRHRVVPDTVHMYRVSRPGSQHAENSRAGLLPYLPDGFWSMKLNSSGGP